MRTLPVYILCEWEVWWKMYLQIDRTILLFQVSIFLTPLTYRSLSLSCTRWKSPSLHLQSFASLQLMTTHTHYFETWFSPKSSHKLKRSSISGPTTSWHHPSTSIACSHFTSPLWAYPRRQSWRRYLTTAVRHTTTAQRWPNLAVTVRCRIIATSIWITSIHRRGSSVAIARHSQVFNSRSWKRPSRELIIPMSLPGKASLRRLQFN